MILQNNADALVRLKSTDKAALQEKFGAQEPVNGKIVAALYNEDTDAAKMALFTANPAGIVTGLKILCVLTGAAGAELIVPHEINEQEYQANAGIADLSLTVTVAALVNCRAHAADRIVTPDEAAALAERLMGREPGILAAADDAPLAEYAPETPVTELIGSCKGILADHHFYNADQLRTMTLQELCPKSGVLHTLSQADCAVAAAKEELLSLRHKSCGKCTFCREGLYQLHQIAEKVTAGRAPADTVAFMQEIAQAMTVSCNCSLGKNAGQPILTLLSAFADEAAAHIRRRECSTGVCLDLTNFYIDPTLCKGEGACAAVCPSHAITLRSGYVSVLDSFDCTRCGACLSACGQGAVKKVSGKLPNLPGRPVRIRGAAASPAITADKTERSRVRRKRMYAPPCPAVKNIQTETPTTIPEKKAQVNILKTLTTDLVIIAGGPAGLAAAIAAGEKGMKSIILEKSSATGGAANMGMGPLGIDTKIQKAAFNNISVADALDLHMKYTHYQVDEDLVQTYFHRSANTIEWLEDMGVEFAGAFRYFKESEATWHIVKPDNGVIGPRAAGAMVPKHDTPQNGS